MASIRQRGRNSWQITVSCGYKSNGQKDFKQQTVKRPEGLTDRQWDKQLDDLAHEFESSVRRGTYHDPARYTVSDFITKWLDERGKDFEKKTLYRYEGMLKGRINEVLGHIKLDQVKPLMLLDFYKNLQELGIREDTVYIQKTELPGLLVSNEIQPETFSEAADISLRTLKSILNGGKTASASKVCAGLNTLISKKTGKASKLKIDDLFTPAGELKPLSGKTIGHYHRVLSVMFHDAVRWGLLQENPCEKVQPPKASRREMKCLDEEALAKILKCLETEDIRCKTLITLALMTGCRRGELVALRWESIDIGKAVIYIMQSAAYTPETGIIIKQPKTQSGNRKIAIPPSTVQLLKQYRKWWVEQKVSRGDQWQKEEREKQGDIWKDPEWLFCTWDGYVIHPDTITDLFKKFLNRHNLPDIRLHDLRHTSATMLINAGLNVRAVAARMGHANPNVTLTVYSHALQSADREAANIMEAIASKKNETEVSN